MLYSNHMFVDTADALERRTRHSDKVAITKHSRWFHQPWFGRHMLPLKIRCGYNNKLVF